MTKKQLNREDFVKRRRKNGALEGCFDKEVAKQGGFCQSETKEWGLRRCTLTKMQLKQRDFVKGKRRNAGLEAVF